MLLFHPKNGSSQVLVLFLFFSIMSFSEDSSKATSPFPAQFQLVVVIFKNSKDVVIF